LRSREVARSTGARIRCRIQCARKKYMRCALGSARVSLHLPEANVKTKSIWGRDLISTSVHLNPQQVVAIATDCLCSGKFSSERRQLKSSPVNLRGVSWMFLISRQACRQTEAKSPSGCPNGPALLSVQSHVRHLKRISGCRQEPTKSARSKLSTTVEIVSYRRGRGEENASSPGPARSPNQS
jgi:hypothetical protein